MPMNRDTNFNTKLYNDRIHVDSDRVYKVTKKNIFVESYVDQPSISVEVFWRDYAYSGLADKWFPHIDPDTIEYRVSSGQYDMGTDVRAYGRLIDPPSDIVQNIKNALEERKTLQAHNREIDKKIKELENSKHEIPLQLFF